MGGISTMYSFLHNPPFPLSCDHLMWKQTCELNVELIIFGSQLVHTAFSGFNTFIYELAFDRGIARDFTVKYSSAAPACSMFHVFLL